MDDAAVVENAQALAVAGKGPAFLPPFAASRLGTMGIELELMVLDRLTYDLLPAARALARRRRLDDLRVARRAVDAGDERAGQRAPPDVAAGRGADAVRAAAARRVVGIARDDLEDAGRQGF